MSNLYFNEESGYSEKVTNEIFRATILHHSVHASAADVLHTVLE